MSRFWPHTPYAEDQPLPRTILTTHVQLRALTTGALLSSTYTTLRQAIPRTRLPNFPQRLLLNAGKGALWIQPLMAIALVGRMHGREEIEWKDRSWRLLENRGQVEVDDWTAVGMVLAGAGWAGSGMGRGLKGGRWVLGLTGAGALGSIGGMVGYMAWRYGMNGGRFPEKKEVAV